MTALPINYYNSLRKNSKGLVIMLVAALFTSIGQMFWKLSYGTDIKFIILGFFCYGVGAVLMIMAFKYGSLSVLHPMMSLSYIFAIVWGHTILKEIITLPKLIAILLIMIGVTFIGVGDE